MTARGVARWLKGGSSTDFPDDGFEGRGEAAFPTQVTVGPDGRRRTAGHLWHAEREEELRRKRLTSGIHLEAGASNVIYKKISLLFEAKIIF